MWCLGVGCLALALVMLHTFVPQRARDVARAQTDAPARDGLDLTSLNVRLSQRAIHPPKSLVKEVVESATRPSGSSQDRALAEIRHSGR